MKRTPSKARRKPARAKKNPYLKIAIIAFVLLLIGAVSYHYRDGLAYYFGFKSDKARREAAADKRLADLRNIQVLVRHDGMAVGFDVSEYQGIIDWPQADSIDVYPFEYVFIRATAGKDRTDARFKQNWTSAGKQKLLRGAYHYYRPNENSIEQAQHFINTVALKDGDLPPVLDIEQLPETQSVDSLKVGLRRWLNKVENHYKVKPIIYSGEKYYDDFLKEEFSEYTFWIANYNFFVDEIDEDWLFWQFTEKGSVPGIAGDVDINIFNGSFSELKTHVIKR
ncbi:MAG TPA: GH25 family lysozyme [Flavobacterium sp.]|jgi:lysozyme